MSDTINDGGPAFPCAEDHKVASDILWTQGMSKRELFAAILMHSEAVTCGVPGEACDALVEASRQAGTDVIDHMAGNAVQGADALLRALSEPKPEPAPAFPRLDVYAATGEQKDALRSLHTRTWFEELPEVLRTYVIDAVDSLARAEAGDDDIPF